jgi:hypothetical protein
VTKHDDQANRTPTRPRSSGDTLTPDLQAQLGRRLKAVYDGMLSEPIPDRFTQLLAQLDSGSRGPKASDDPDSNKGS